MICFSSRMNGSAFILFWCRLVQGLFSGFSMGSTFAERKQRPVLLTHKCTAKRSLSDSPSYWPWQSELGGKPLLFLYVYLFYKENTCWNISASYIIRYLVTGYLNLCNNTQFFARPLQSNINYVRYNNFLTYSFNLLNPTGHVMHQQLNIQQL